MASVTSSTCFGIYVTSPSIGAITTEMVRVKTIVYHPSGNSEYQDIQDSQGRDVVKFLSTSHGSVSIDLYDTQFDGLKISASNSSAGTISILLV